MWYNISNNLTKKQRATSMKSLLSKNSHTYYRKMFIICSLIVLLIGCTVFALEKTHITNFIKDPFYKETNLNTDKATMDNPTIDKKGSVEVTPGVDANKTTVQIPESNTTSILIKSLNQLNRTVNADIDITNASSEGICSYTFTKDGAKPATRSVNTNNSNCPISIPELEFEMIGLWKLEVKYFSNNKQTTINSEIDIKQ